MSFYRPQQYTRRPQLALSTYEWYPAIIGQHLALVIPQEDFVAAHSINERYLMSAKTFARHEALFVALFMVLVFIAAGYTLINQIEPSRDGWNTNFAISSVPLADIMDSGMGRDEIAPIDSPRLQRADTVTWLGQQSPVIAVVINGEARAYPLAVLLRHQIINDVIDGQAVAVTFCPLCHSPIVYDRRMGDDVLRFGVSGNIYKSGFIMWDNLTESWWHQFTGRAIVGSYTNAMLDVIPSYVLGFATFAGRYPDGMVLVGDENKPAMEYGRNPYVGYDSSLSPMMYKGEMDGRLEPTVRVLTGIIAGVPIAYPFPILAQDMVINDSIDGQAVVAFWQPGATSALDNASIDRSQDVGMASLFLRELDGETMYFYAEAGAIRDETSGSAWNIFGEAIDGPLRGRRLQAIPCNVNFWFAWATAYPETLIYSQ